MLFTPRQIVLILTCCDQRRIISEFQGFQFIQLTSLPMESQKRPSYSNPLEPEELEEVLMGEELVEILMGEEVAEPRVQFCSSSQDNDNVENPAADQTQQSDDDKTLAVNTFFKLQEKLTAKISEANIQEYEALVARQ